MLRLGPADLEGYRALRLAGVAEDPGASGSTYEEEAGRDFTPVLERGNVFGAFLDGRLVGMGAIGREEKAKLRHRAEIYGIYTSPEARGKGVARALMEALIAEARALGGIEVLALGVTVGNAPARALYRKLGFVSVGVEPAFLKVGDVRLDQERMVLFL